MPATVAQGGVAWLSGYILGPQCQICPGFRTQHCLFLAESPWAGDSTSLSLSFPCLKNGNHNLDED